MSRVCNEICGQDQRVLELWEGQSDKQAPL